MSFARSNGKTGPRVAIIFEGSRGDSQPYISAGKELQKAGFSVLLAGAADCAPMAADFGVELVEYLPSFQEILNHPDSVKTQTSNDIVAMMGVNEKLKEGQFEPGMQILYDRLKQFQPEIMMAGIVNHLDIIGLSNILNCACVYFGLQTTLPSNYVAALGFLPYFPPWTGLNMRAWKMFGKFAIYNENTKRHVPFLEEMSGMSRDAFWPTYEEWMSNYVPTSSESPLPFPLMLGVSSTLSAPLPADFTPQHVVLGQMVVRAEDQKGELFGGGEEQSVQAFLAKGSPPVYMGFGSITCENGKFMTLLCLRALKRSGERGIFCAGWSGLGDFEHLDEEPDEKELKDYMKRNVFCMKTAAHGKLFPKCKVLVHHGGAGTFSAALRAGVPQVICPIIFDQFAHSDYLNENGNGIGMKQMKSATPDELAEAIQTCATSSEMLDAANELGEALRKEDGLTQLVEALRRHYKEEVATGRHVALQKQRLKDFAPKPWFPQCGAGSESDSEAESEVAE